MCIAFDPHDVLGINIDALGKLLDGQSLLATHGLDQRAECHAHRIEGIRIGEFCVCLIWGRVPGEPACGNLKISFKLGPAFEPLPRDFEFHGCSYPENASA